MDWKWTVPFGFLWTVHFRASSKKYHPFLFTYRIALIRALIPTHFHAGFSMATNTFWSKLHAVIAATWDHCWANLNIKSGKRTLVQFLKTPSKTYRLWLACIGSWIPAQFGAELRMAPNTFWSKFHTVFTCAWKDCWANLQKWLFGRF